MKFSLKKAKKITSLVLAFVMVLGLVEGITLGAFAVDAKAEEANPLTTIWKTANIGCEAGGSYQYDAEAKKITVTGAGTAFNKDGGADSYYYAYFDVNEGKNVIVAKMNPISGAVSGMSGIIVRNGVDADSVAAGAYWDYNKGQLRMAHRNGASNKLNITEVSTDVYVKLEFSKNAVYYTVASDPSFAEDKILVARSGMGATGLEAVNIGFFATAGNVAEYSDVQIKSEYKDDLGNTVKKIVFDSNTGELIPTFSSSKDYSGNWSDRIGFNSSVEGNILKLEGTYDGTIAGSKGSIREDKSTTYLLFPETDEDMTISATIKILGIDGQTDKHGFGIGQFVAKNGTTTTMSVLQLTKNNNTQHNFTKESGGTNGGNPKSDTVSIGSSYTLSYQKAGSKVTMLTKDASGAVISLTTDPIDFTDLATYDISQKLLSGKKVQYGVAVCVPHIEMTDLTLTNSEGYIVYDQNDYYKVKGVAPVVNEITKAEVNEDRSKIELEWSFTEGAGSQSYIIMVSKNGGEYTGAGKATVNSFSYTPDGDGTYKFKVYGKAGDSVSLDQAKESTEVVYVKPLPKPVITVDSKDKSVVIDLGATLPEGANRLDLWRSTTKNGQYECIKSFEAGGSYTDEGLTNEQPYYYYAVAVNFDGTKDINTSNPSEIMQALPNAGHAGAYVYGTEAAKFTVVDKSNDTVEENKAFIKAKTDKAGTAKLVVAGEVVDTKSVAADEEFTFDITGLEEGRNDVELLLTDEAGKTSRKVFNFVYLTHYDILVDSAYAGEDGQGTVPTYKTVKAAIDSVAADNTKTKVIYIKNGDYNERIEITKPFVSLLGEDSVKTRIYKSVAVSDKTATGMWDRNVVYVTPEAENFSAENLTIENSFAYNNGSDQQADALAIAADKAVVVNVRLISYQDTLLVATKNKVDGKYVTTRQLFSKCFITGNVDFVYGDSTAYFEDCDFVGRYTSYKKDGCYMAARTYSEIEYGYVFNNCRFLYEDGIEEGQYRLARPWGKDASNIFINCFMDKALAETAYGDMSGNLYKNARFAEFNTYGPLFKINNDRPLLSAEEAKQYSLTNIMGDFDARAFASDVSKAYAYVAPADTDKVKAFVERLYSLALGREADAAGLESWSGVLINRDSNSVDVGFGFVFSPENADRQLSDDEFVEMLYLTFMDRPSDEGGKVAWVSQLEAGVDREKVFEGFVMSDEFKGICNEYGITLGSVDDVPAMKEVVDMYRNQNADVTKFVARCYSEFLGRGGDPEGIEAWCKALITKENTPKEVASVGFIASGEFQERVLTNEEYVRLLYSAFLGREADPVGLEGWVNTLVTGEHDRETILDGFVDSEEFAAILTEFGLAD